MDKLQVGIILLLMGFVAHDLYAIMHLRNRDKATPIEQDSMTQVASVSPSCTLFRFYDPEHNAHYLCKDIKDMRPQYVYVGTKYKGLTQTEVNT